MILLSFIIINEHTVHASYTLKYQEQTNRVQ